MRPTLRTHVGRRLQILAELLAHEAEHGAGLGVVGLAGATGREKTQISRGLKGLLDAGLVERDPDSREFITGLRVLDLAGRAGQPLLLRRARPVCQRLASEAGERVSLAAGSGRGVLTVETFAAVASVQATGWVGQVLPWDSAAGRVLLMAADEQQLQEILNHNGTVADRTSARAMASLRADLPRTRMVGHSITYGEPAAEPTTVAAPIVDAAGHPYAAVVLAGPAERLERRLKATARLVVAAAAMISDAMHAPADLAADAAAGRSRP